MPGSAWEWILTIGVLAGPVLLASLRRGSDLVTLSSVLGAILGCGYVLLVPGGERPWAILFAMAAAIGNAALCLAPRRAGEPSLRAVRQQKSKVGIVVLAVLFVPLGFVEMTCRVLTAAGVLPYHEAIRTVWRAGDDEWRLATITADRHREPDPVLLWRPIARKPYTSQRFKGPEVQVPKPDGVFRIMCYGDSLTDGPRRGGWPTWLHALLNRVEAQVGRNRRVEVLNAGVSGYTTHQGLRRFLQEADRYQPDLVLVSFGWNDAAEAIGGPDKEFHVPPWPLVVAQRALVRYRAYLVLMEWTRGLRPTPPPRPPGISGPRVSIEDYLANLEQFRALAAERGIRVVFLTRPHKLSPEELSRYPTWRGTVPRYNEALREWAARQGVSLIDAQRHFVRQSPELFSDECHFTPRGYELMARFVRDRLGDEVGFPLGSDSPIPIASKDGARELSR
jgi:lysophospholipase L1-like esterase